MPYGDGARKSSGYRVGSFLGGRLTLTVELPFFVTVVLLGSAASRRDPALAAAAAAVVALSILIHELGHSFACLALGRDADVVLHGFGGYTRPRGPGALGAWRNVAVTAAGPAAGLLLAAVCSRSAAAGTLGPVAEAAARYAARLNFLWSLFNLLPVSPLDGGHLLGAVLKGRFGLAGLRAAHAVGALVASGAGLVALGFGGFFDAAFLGALAVGEVAGWRRARTLTEADFDDGLHGELKAAQAARREGRAREAFRRLVGLRLRSRAGRVHRAATEQLARWLFEDGRDRAAYALLRTLDEGELLPGSRLALQELAYRSADYETAIRLGQTNFHENPDPRTAAAIAAACARLGDARRGLQWLNTAVRRGLPDAASILREPDFDAIRGDPDFAELERSLAERR